MAFYTASAVNIRLLPNKALLGIFNQPGSNQIIKIVRMILLNSQVTAVSGIGQIFEIYKTSSATGGIPLLVLKKNSNDPDILSNILVSSNMSFATSELIMRFLWSTDEPLMFANSPQTSFQLIPELNSFLDNRVSFSQTELTPDTIREGEGIVLLGQNISNNIGVIDIFLEFEAVDI
jgi:hypothetical protein